MHHLAGVKFFVNFFQAPRDPLARVHGALSLSRHPDPLRLGLLHLGPDHRPRV